MIRVFLRRGTPFALLQQMRKHHQLTLNLFDEPLATQLVLDFAEEELICVFWTRDNNVPPNPVFLLFPVSEVIAACRRERKKVIGQAHGATYTCSESMIQGCIDEMRVGLRGCAWCYGELISKDVIPKTVATHPMNFIAESDRP